MKTLEEKAEDYSNRNDLITAYRGEGDFGYEAIEQAYIAGYNEANKWYDIYDKEHIMPTDCEILIKLENGKIRRFDEDWQDEFGIMDGIVAHWRPIE